MIRRPARRHARLGTLPHARAQSNGIVRPKRPLWVRLHRWLGLAAAVFLLIVTLTGLAANHAHTLGLDRAWPQAGWLLRHYGVAVPEPVAARAGGSWLLWRGGQLSLDGAQVASDLPHLLGAAAVDDAGEDLLVAAGMHSLLLLMPDGTLVERFEAQALPGTLRRIGSANGALVIESDTGRWTPTRDWSGWQATSVEPAWSQVGPAPAGIAVPPANRDISWERVLLDLHSGRLFGLPGVVFNDLVGIALLLLLGTGLYGWWQRRG